MKLPTTAFNQAKIGFCKKACEAFDDVRPNVLELKLERRGNWRILQADLSSLRYGACTLLQRAFRRIILSGNSFSRCLFLYSRLDRLTFCLHRKGLGF
ncbi:hypothetical protein ACET3Z_008031 [Daucus carota]